MAKKPCKPKPKGIDGTALIDLAEDVLVFSLSATVAVVTAVVLIHGIIGG